MPNKQQSRIVAILAVVITYELSGQAPALASYEEGVAAYNGHRYADAVRLLSDAKAKDFGNATLHYYLANALAAVKQKNQAIQEYKIALDLQPDGQLATYCESALKTLNGDGLQANQSTKTTAWANAGRKNDVGGSALGALQNRYDPSFDPTLNPNLKPNSQPARCLSFLCGCKLCARFEVLLAELQSKYGDKIKFIRTTRETAQSSTSFNPYGNMHCPTIELFGEEGAMDGRYDEKSSEEMVRNGVIAVASRARLSTLAATTNPHLVASRDEIVHEVMARIASDRVRVDAEIKAIRHSAIEDSPNRGLRMMVAAGADVDTINFSLDDASKKRVLILEDEFKRKKREWIGEAEKKLQALGLTGTDASLAQLFSDSD